VVAIGAVLLFISGDAAADVADPTSTNLSCAPASPATGSATTCTATVTDSSAAGATTPTGTVSFQSSPDTGAFGSSGACTLAATATTGVASCQLGFTPSAGGDYIITATYNGDGDGTHSGSIDSTPFIAVDATSASVSCTPANPVVGEPTDCTATVTDANGSYDIRGAVTFSAQPAASGSFGTPGPCKFTPSAGSGKSTCPIRFTPRAPGAITIEAQFAGDNYHAASSGSVQLRGSKTPPGDIVPPGTTPPGPPRGLARGSVTITPKALVAPGGLAAVRLICAGVRGATCSGVLRLSYTPARRRAVDARRKPIVFGSVAYTLIGPSTSPVGIRLSKSALRLLSSAPHRTLTVTASATQVGARSVTRTIKVTLLVLKPRKHKPTKPAHHRRR
jgi:hypothetical protein